MVIKGRTSGSGAGAEPPARIPSRRPSLLRCPSRLQRDDRPFQIIRGERQPSHGILHLPFEALATLRIPLGDEVASSSLPESTSEGMNSWQGDTGRRVEITRVERANENGRIEPHGRPRDPAKVDFEARHDDHTDLRHHASIKIMPRPRPLSLNP